MITSSTTTVTSGHALTLYWPWSHPCHGTVLRGNVETTWCFSCVHVLRPGQSAQNRPPDFFSWHYRFPNNIAHSKLLTRWIIISKQHFLFPPVSNKVLHAFCRTAGRVRLNIDMQACDCCLWAVQFLFFSRLPFLSSLASDIISALKRRSIFSCSHSCWVSLLCQCLGRAQSSRSLP